MEWLRENKKKRKLFFKIEPSLFLQPPSHQPEIWRRAASSVDKKVGNFFPSLSITLCAPFPWIYSIAVVVVWRFSCQSRFPSLNLHIFYAHWKEARKKWVQKNIRQFSSIVWWPQNKKLFSLPKYVGHNMWNFGSLDYPTQLLYIFSQSMSSSCMIATMLIMSTMENDFFFQKIGGVPPKK